LSAPLYGIKSFDTRLLIVVFHGFWVFIRISLKIPKKRLSYLASKAFKFFKR
jgi:hypothetical protein